MPDVIDQLRRYGDAVEAAVPPAAVPGRHGRPRRHRALRVAAVVVAVLAIGGAAVALTRDGDEGRRVDVTDTPPPRSGWRSLPSGPLPPREGSALVWTGDELVVWGGYQQADGYRARADGAAYDPATDTWRPLADAPIPGGPATGVWTGTEVLVWSIVAEPSGSNDGGWVGAAWDPVTGAWRRLATAPRGTVDGVVAPLWTGEEMVDVDLGAAYDPAADRWRRLAERPVAGPVAASVWTGSKVIALVQNRSDPSYPAGEAVALTYDPDGDRWRALPPTGVGETAVALAWDGRRAIAVDYEMRAASYRPDEGRWRPLPPLPLRFYECSPGAAPVAGTVLVRHCSGQAILTDRDEWAIGLPLAGPSGALVPTAEALLSWWSSDYYGDPPGSALQAYRPPELANADLALERTIPVGTVRLDLLEGSRLTDTSITREAGGSATRLGFELTLEDDTRCTLRSTYGAIRSEIRIRNDASTVDARLGRTPLEGVDTGRDEALVARVPAGVLDGDAHVLLEETTSDVLDVACPDLATADLVLTRIHR